MSQSPLAQVQKEKPLPKQLCGVVAEASKGRVRPVPDPTVPTRPRGRPRRVTSAFSPGRGTGPKLLLTW